MGIIFELVGMLVMVGFLLIGINTVIFQKQRRKR